MKNNTDIISQILKLKSQKVLSQNDKTKIQKLQQELNEDALNPVKFI